MAELIQMPLGCGLRWPKEVRIRWGCTLAPPHEYNWSIHLRRWCGLMSNYFDH